jgi:hypothetical protein
MTEEPPQDARVVVERPPTPSLHRSDAAALAAAWTGLVLGAALKLTNPGWMLVFGAVLALPLLVWGIVVIQRLLAPNVAVVTDVPAPRTVRVLAWIWGACALLPGLVMPDGGDAAQWTAPLSTLLGTPAESEPYMGLAMTAVGVAALAVFIINVTLSGYLRARTRRDPAG